MGSVLDRLVDGVRGQAKQRADARRNRRAEMPNMVDVEALQRNTLGQRDLYFVGGGHPAQDVGARPAALLGNGKDRGDAVARMTGFDAEEAVVKVEFAHCRSVSPGRPFAMDAYLAGHSMDKRATRPWMC